MALPGWMDPKEATTSELLLLAGTLALVLVVLAYGIAFLWQRFRDQKA